MKKSKFLASMMCSDYMNIAKEVSSLKNAGIDGYHIDIMDGHYVQNFGIDPSMIGTLRKLDETGIIDVHLMVQRPDLIIGKFLNKKINRIQFHPNSTVHALRLVETIKEAGIEAGIVINPDENIDVFDSLYPFVDHVTLMTVSPGFAGQSFVKSSIERYMQIIEKGKKYSFEITLDGALSPSRIKKFDEYGTNNYVLGTSALFNDDTFSNNLKKINM